MMTSIMFSLICGSWVGRNENKNKVMQIEGDHWEADGKGKGEGKK
jgi:hypothetical protein